MLLRLEISREIERNGRFCSVACKR
jgi:hypothetical protein